MQRCVAGFVQLVEVRSSSNLALDGINISVAFSLASQMDISVGNPTIVRGRMSKPQTVPIAAKYFFICRRRYAPKYAMQVLFRWLVSLTPGRLRAVRLLPRLSSPRKIGRTAPRRRGRWPTAAPSQPRAWPRDASVSWPASAPYVAELSRKA